MDFKKIDDIPLSDKVITCGCAKDLSSYMEKNILNDYVKTEDFADKLNALSGELIKILNAPVFVQWLSAVADQCLSTKYEIKKTNVDDVEKEPETDSDEV